MKKAVFFVLILLVLVYAIIENKGRILLFVLSPRHNLSLFFPSGGGHGQMYTYRDGTYTGPSVDAFYGTVQVQTTISKGKITQVTFLHYPHDALRSIAINSIAMPNLQGEAIQAQNAQVDIISGATDTSQAFIQSLQSTLAQAKKA